MTVLLPPSPGEGMDVFFNARSIAVIGASSEFTKIGGRPIHLLRKYGYSGDIYPINPKGGVIQDLKAFTRLADTPIPPELAVVAVPAEQALQAVRDCAQRGIKAVVVLSSGFAEAGPAGLTMQSEMTRVARSHGMRLMGPNCLGSLGVANKVIGSFSVALEDHMPQAGGIGIVSQSGNIGSYTLQILVQRGVGISAMITTGNEADVDLADGIAALARDPKTRVILCCMETCRDGNRLRQALEVAREHLTPVIMLKIGATEQGQAAAASHTGALAASDAVIDAVFRRHGALRVGSHEDLVEIGLAADQLLPNRLPRQAEATLIAASGGFCIMMADAMSAAGINLPHLAQATQDRIHAALPSAITNNPVDSSAQISSKPETLLEVLSALQEDPGDRVCVLFQSLSLYSSRLRGIYIEAMTRLRERYPQRVLVVISRGPEDAVQHIRQLGIPVFSSIDSAARGVAGLVRLSQLLEAPLSPAEVSTLSDKPLPATAFQNEFGAKRALASEGFAIPKEQQVHSADEAAQAAQAIGFPVVLKVVSQDLPHKTEAGGVALNLNDAKAVRTAYTRIMANVAQHAPNAKIEGILVAPMLIDGVELIAGISRDPVFGPVVMVGMGGIYAEVLRDVSVQVAPVSEKQALEMIRSLRLFSLLDGARGKAPLDQLAAARLVSQLSEFACRHSGQVAEIDLNPILVRAKGEGVAVLDALMIPVHSSTSLEPETAHAH
jgi:acyl-CoA synthetase (NDP forming)